MKKVTLLIVIVIIFSVFAMPAHAAIKKVAQVGFQFLKIDVGARAAAMGGSYLLVGEDASAMFYNPAGIARMKSGFDVFVGRTEWAADITYDAAGLVKSLGDIGSIGVSIISCNYGDMIGTRVAQTEKGYEETGNLDVGAYAVGLTFARELTNKFTVGGQIRYATQKLGENLVNIDGETVDNKLSGLAFDFGTIFYPGYKSLRFGMSIRNFSKEFKYQEEGFQLPLTFTIGIAFDVLDFVGEHSNSLLISVDALHPRDYTERLHIGGEYWFMDMVALRAGYKYNYDEEGLCAGAGFKGNVGGLDLKLDYSYSDLGTFDAANRFTFGFSF